MIDKLRIREILLSSPLEEALVDELVEVGRAKKVKAGSLVMSASEENAEIPFVLDGLMRVVRPDGSGGELFLYYLEAGNTCAMSVGCCLEKRPVDISLKAETDALIWLVPLSYMDRWVEKYRSFRKYIFRAYQDRFDELLTALDSVAFMKMDERLMNYLLDRKVATGSLDIHMTHEQIARDLNSSRVVISRLLKSLENKGEIVLHRNRIEIM